MASTYQLKNGDVIADYGVNETLGIRIGCDAARRMVSQGHVLKGAVVTLATELSLWAAEQRKNPDGTHRHARRTAVVKGDGTRVRPRLTINAIECAEWYYAPDPETGAKRTKRPNEATMRAMIDAINADAKGPALVTELRSLVSDASTPNVAAQDREQRRQREQARRLAAKASR